MIDKNWFRTVLDRIPNMTIQLDISEITTIHPSFLRKKLDECRKLSNEINAFFQNVKKVMWDVDHEGSARKAEYNIKLESLIATDARVQKGLSYKDRVATANQILREDINAINQLESDLRDLKALEEVIKVKMRELKDLGADIRTAKQLIQTEIEIGGGYGGEEPNEKPLDPISLLEGVPLPSEFKLQPLIAKNNDMLCAAGPTEFVGTIPVRVDLPCEKSDSEKLNPFFGAN
jgi:hypothetical protein